GSLEKQDYDPNNESSKYYDCLSWHVVQGWEKLLYDPGSDTGEYGEYYDVCYSHDFLTCIQLCLTAPSALQRNTAPIKVRRMIAPEKPLRSIARQQLCNGAVSIHI